jgi:hypothetical protein
MYIIQKQNKITHTKTNKNTPLKEHKMKKSKSNKNNKLTQAQKAAKHLATQAKMQANKAAKPQSTHTQAQGAPMQQNQIVNIMGAAHRKLLSNPSAYDLLARTATSLGITNFETSGYLMGTIAMALGADTRIAEAIGQYAGFSNSKGLDVNTFGNGCWVAYSGDGETVKVVVKDGVSHIHLWPNDLNGKMLNELDYFSKMSKNHQLAVEQVWLTAKRIMTPTDFERLNRKKFNAAFVATWIIQTQMDINEGLIK